MVNSLRRIEIDENFIIPPDSLGIAKPFMSVEIPYSELI